MKGIQKMVRQGVLLALALHLASGVARADEALEQRELAATAKTISATVLAQYHGTYKAVRDQRFHGDHGLVKALDAWIVETHAWIATWGTLLALVDQAGSVPYARVEAEAQALIQRQDAALGPLGAKADAIAGAAREAIALLAKAEVPAGAELAPYQEVVDGLKQRHAELARSFAELEDEAGSRMHELAEIRRVTEEVALAKLRVALLASGGVSLEASLSRFREMLDAERLLGGAFVALDALEKEAMSNQMSMRLYHLEANVREAQRECPAVRQKIATAALATRYKEAGLARADRHCNAIEKLYRDLLALDSATVIVGDYVDSVKVRAQRICRGAEAPVVCEKFAVLAAIPFERVRQMSAAALSVYEHEWASVERVIP